MSEPHEVTIEELQRAIKKRWRSSETYVAYQRSPRSPRSKATAEAVYPLLLEHAAWAVGQAHLQEPDPTRNCPTCGCQWEADIGACPECQDRMITNPSQPARSATKEPLERGDG